MDKKRKNTFPDKNRPRPRTVGPPSRGKRSRHVGAKKSVGKKKKRVGSRWRRQGTSPEDIDEAATKRVPLQLRRRSEKKRRERQVPIVNKASRTVRGGVAGTNPTPGVGQRAIVVHRKLG